MSEFIKNAWYVAAWSNEVGRKLFSRKILGESVVFYRKKDNTPVAMVDRCPHKLLPLSKGRLKDDNIECGYHGLHFDCTGRCVKVPGQSKIPPSAQVRRFPLIEKYNAIWIWMGDEEKASLTDIVEIPQYNDKAWGLVDGQYLNFKTNVRNICDNLVDPAHTSYVHPLTIGHTAAENVAVKVEENEDSILAYRWTNDSPPVPIMEKYGNFNGSSVDRWQYYYLVMPSISIVDFGALKTGLEHTEENKDAAYRTYTYNLLTPETDSTTHYFWLHLRNFEPVNKEIDEDIVRLYTQTFNEDADILIEIQREQEITGVHEFTRLAIDNAPARIRRMIGRQLEKESVIQ